MLVATGLRRSIPALVLGLVCALAVPAAASGTPSGPLVAVVDSGVDFRHPALQGTAWRNPGEVPGNRVDDDANGFVDDVSGVDFVGDGGGPADPRGHGTHVAGLIVRRMGNGGLGRRTGARIMSLRVLRRDGTSATSALVAAIHYAVDHGARLINLSLTHYAPSPELRAALQRAAGADVLVLAAAGNGRQNLDRTPIYPASYRTPSMIVVAAAWGRGLEPWSARGRRSVDIAAPGSGVLSAVPRGRYGRKTGTSQATAVVTRAAVLAFGVHPTASAETVRQALLRGSRKSPRLRRTIASGGRLDLRGALYELTRAA